jgi:dihydroorotate dehydrogenase
MDAEKAHNFAIKNMHRFPKLMSGPFCHKNHNDKYKIDIGPIKWDFPVGLAAGLDKNAEALNFFSRLLFGAVEIGTVTPLPQEGNAKPRMFRYISEESLRNCMGFNNGGSEEVYNNIMNTKDINTCLGINLGKNKTTSVEDTPLDYKKLYNKFYQLADYLVINVSSPNTPGLRDLQQTESLALILDAIAEDREANPTPLFIKISPDLSFDDIPGIVELASKYKITGLIATNTTIMKDRGAGGVSGKLLTNKAKEIRFKVLESIKAIDPTLEFIGVGGISGFDELWDFWKAGGKACQIYTAFIFQGPQILDDIKNEIDRVLELNNKNTVKELLENIEEAKR